MIKKIIILGMIWTNFSYYPISSNAYHTVDTPVSQSISLLDKDKKLNYPITIVLRRTGCIYCKQDEKIIVPRVKTMRAEHQIVYVLDVKKMNHKELEYIKKNFKSILYKGKIPTPTVFTAVPNKDHHAWKITEKCNNGNIVQIKKLLR